MYAAASRFEGEADPLPVLERAEGRVRVRIAADDGRSRPDRCYRHGSMTVRVEPGQSREVTLVKLAGEGKVCGFNQKVMGAL